MKKHQWILITIAILLLVFFFIRPKDTTTAESQADIQQKALSSEPETKSDGFSGVWRMYTFGGIPIKEIPNEQAKQDLLKYRMKITKDGVNYLVEEIPQHMIPGPQMSGAIDQYVADHDRPNIKQPTTEDMTSDFSKHRCTLIPGENKIVGHYIVITYAPESDELIATYFGSNPVVLRRNSDNFR